LRSLLRLLWQPISSINQIKNRKSKIQFKSIQITEAANKSANQSVSQPMDQAKVKQSRAVKQPKTKYQVISLKGVKSTSAL
jgi:hypothetical protein